MIVAISSDWRGVGIVMASREEQWSVKKAQLGVSYRNRMEEKLKARGLDAVELRQDNRQGSNSCSI